MPNQMLSIFIAVFVSGIRTLDKEKNEPDLLLHVTSRHQKRFVVVAVTDCVIDKGVSIVRLKSFGAKVSLGC